MIIPVIPTERDHSARLADPQMRYELLAVEVADMVRRMDLDLAVRYLAAHLKSAHDCGAIVGLDRADAIVAARLAEYRAGRERQEFERPTP